MSNLKPMLQNIYSSNFTPTPYPTCSGSTLPQLATKAELGIMRRGSEAITHEHCTATLTACALENTMHLAALAGAAYQLAPWAAEEYHDIVKAYADSAIRHIREF